jgi:hypothetical protein
LALAYASAQTAILTFPAGWVGWVGGFGGWMEELELKQTLQFSFGLGLCKIWFRILVQYYNAVAAEYGA